MNLETQAGHIKLIRKTLADLHGCVDEKATPKAHAALRRHHAALERAGKDAGFDVTPLSGGGPKPPVS